MEVTSTTLATVEDLAGEAAAAVPRTDAPEQMPDEMFRAVAATDTKQEVLERLADCLKRHAHLAAVLYYDRDNGPRLTDRLHWLDHSAELEQGQLSAALDEVCAQACQRGTSQLRTTFDGFPCPTVVVPITGQNEPGEALCALLGPETTQTPERVCEMLQLAAGQITVWRSRQAAQRAEHEARSFAALLELIEELNSSEDLRSGCRGLVHRLQSFLHCERVAVGVCPRSSRHCQLRAISGIARFDKHAELVTAVEAALDETLLLNKIIRWPPAEDDERLPARTHEQLLAALGADSVLSAPLHDAHGDAVGACLLLNPRDDEGDVSAVEFLDASQQQLGSCLRSLQRRRGGPWSRAWRKLSGRFPQRRMTIVGLAAAAVSLFLAWPCTHKIACDFQLQPVVRRFVAAPYDGNLKKALVQPGDIVDVGDVLAQMDDREARLTLSALEAEHGRARKAWEVSLSLDDIHDAQQAKLEMKRLELKMQLLREQQENLQIKSPLRGFVVSGDLKKSQGSPLSVGQSLFEIAPLDRMKVEIFVPEQEIAYVRSGMETRIRLDAYPRQLHVLQITHVVPRAEAREDQFVFVAEAELDNPEGSLRPGMNGRATLMGSRRTMAWILFHKPYESLLMLLGW